MQPRSQAAAPIRRLPHQSAEIVTLLTHLSDQAVVFRVQDRDIFETTRAWRLFWTPS